MVLRKGAASVAVAVSVEMRSSSVYMVHMDYVHSIVELHVSTA